MVRKQGKEQLMSDQLAVNIVNGAVNKAVIRAVIRAVNNTSLLRALYS
jgi:hypothetical protein